MEEERAPKFTLDPRQPPTSLPTSNSYSPFQLSTQTGTVVIDLTTTDGLFIFTPCWAEKVMGWYYPMDPATRTFGAVIPLSYNIDIDQFYEAYRVISALFTVIGNTTSTTLAAFSGNFNGCEAYNSLSGLIGNNSDVYQIYSYSNILGLTSDPLRKEGAVPAYEGIGAFFLSNPRRPWARLEDSVPYSPGPNIVPQGSYFKFVDTSETYNLTGVVEYTIPSFIANTPVSNIYSSGEILMDFMRASSINWAMSGVISCNNNTSYFGIKLSYSMKDIAGQTTNTGILWESREGPTVTTNTYWSRSGSFPTIFNVANNGLNPPTRSIFFSVQVYGLQGGGTVTFNGPVFLNLEMPIYNGLKDGVIQSPILIAHSGNEIGTKLSVSGRLNLEAKMNSEVNKFTNVRYRDVTQRYERALMKVASNPGKYNLRYIFRMSQLDSLMDAWDAAVQGCVIKHTEKKLEHLMALYAQCCDDVDKAPPLVKAEAATRATKVLRRIGKKLKGVSSTVAHSVLKPAAEEALKLGKATLAKGLQALMSSIAPNPLSIAATGFIPTAATGFLQAPTRSYYAALKMPKKSLEDDVQKEKMEKQSSSLATVLVPRSEVSLFPVIYLDESADLVENDSTVVGLFAIIASRLLDSKPNSIRTRIKQNCIENYAATAECPNITPIEPRENITIMKVESVTPEGFLLTQPPFTTTGRSLDLAIWAYNNRFAPGCVFSSAVTNGQIQAMDPDVAVLKRKFCDSNKMTLVGNFSPHQISDRCISVKSIAELVKLFSTRNLIQDPKLLQRGWFYAFAPDSVVPLDVMDSPSLPEFDQLYGFTSEAFSSPAPPIGYDGTYLTFLNPITSPKTNRIDFHNGTYRYKLTYSQRHKMQKFLASLCETVICPQQFPRVDAALAVAASKKPKAQAAISITSQKDFATILELASPNIDPSQVAKVWRILSLKGLTLNDPLSGKAVVPVDPTSYNDLPGLKQDAAKNKVLRNKLDKLQVQPVKNRVKKRKVIIEGRKTVRDNFVLTSLPTYVERELLFPIDMRVYRQYLSDPSLLPTVTSDIEKALLYLTFHYFPYTDQTGKARVSKRNIKNFNTCLKYVDENFSADFRHHYEAIPPERDVYIKQQMLFGRLPPALKRFADWCVDSPKTAIQQ